MTGQAFSALVKKRESCFSVLGHECYLAQSMLCDAKSGGSLWVYAARPEGSLDVELTLSNEDCEVLGSMTISWEPTHLCVTDTHVVAASKGSVLVWEISTGATLLLEARMTHGSGWYVGLAVWSS